MIAKKAVVVFSGGMDSSICLALAVREFGSSHVLAVSFDYGQRHKIELEQAKKIATHFQVDHVVLDLHCLNKITDNALTRSKTIEHKAGEAPNTLVAGRNGLMARLGGIHAYGLGAKVVYLGIMELEVANSGYRDCSRVYTDLIQAALRMDFADEAFEISTPLVELTKFQSLEMAQELGVLEFLLENTVTCYEGKLHQGCGHCPACKLRNPAVKELVRQHSDLNFSWKDQLI